MLDHITFGVADLAASGEFYGRLLAPLGVGRLAAYSAEITQGANVIGYGERSKVYFWLQDRSVTGPSHGAISRGTGRLWTPYTPRAWPLAVATAACRA